MSFKKGRRKTGGIKKGQKHKKTILKENLGIEAIENVEQFEPTLIKNWIEFLCDNDKQIKLSATKELSKFVFPTKKQVESTINQRKIEDLINECSNTTIDEDGKLKVNK